jgi:hypothetical protein
MVDDRVLEPKWRLGPWHSVYAEGKREVVGARNLDVSRHAEHRLAASSLPDPTRAMEEANRLEAEARAVFDPIGSVRDDSDEIRTLPGPSGAQ